MFLNLGVMSFDSYPDGVREVPVEGDTAYINSGSFWRSSRPSSMRGAHPRPRAAAAHGRGAAAAVPHQPRRRRCAGQARRLRVVDMRDASPAAAAVAGERGEGRGMCGTCVCVRVFGHIVSKRQVPVAGTFQNGHFVSGTRLVWGHAPATQGRGLGATTPALRPTWRRSAGP